MLVDLTKSKVIILHLQRAIDRKENIKHLKNIFSDVIIYDGIDALKYTSEERKQYLDLKFFHRLPSCKWRDNVLLGHIACSRGHLNILKYIIDNKLDNVIVFEDDVECIDKNLVIDYNNEDYIYLGITKEYKPNKYSGAFSIYYPSYKKLSKMYDILKDPKKFKCFDYMLTNYCNSRNKFNFTIYNKFRVIGESITNNL
jgi:hypothetical protein